MWWTRSIARAEEMSNLDDAYRFRTVALVWLSSPPHRTLALPLYSLPFYLPTPSFPLVGPKLLALLAVNELSAFGAAHMDEVNISNAANEIELGTPPRLSVSYGLSQKTTEATTIRYLGQRLESRCMFGVPRMDRCKLLGLEQTNACSSGLGFVIISAVRLRSGALLHCQC
ncbi:hypothetical protein F4808DRAFT_422138 [Astrocystis sublimbata]|nr:hypothetical protein F4808DRAFT_422138 [Astrocystis sublimbata]